jgi:GABA(A) receptor-associated protein
MPLTHFEKTLEQRQAETRQIKLKHPHRVCVYMLKAAKPTLPNLDKYKYLVPIDITIGQLAYIIRKRIKLSPANAMFLMVNNTMVPTTQTIGETEQKHMNEDGFLYIYYTTENCFG